jgi:hypothetical protein
MGVDAYQNDVVAVVHAEPDTVAVWHVDVGVDKPGFSRMSGAWSKPRGETRTIELVTRQRIVLPTPSGQKALSKAKAAPAGYLDVEAVFSSVIAERDRLQGIYESRKTKSKTLVAPTWPEMPDLLDLDAPPRIEVADQDNDCVPIALGIARWLERLAVAWAAIEGQRVVRAYMVGAEGRSVRPCPITLVS